LFYGGFYFIEMRMFSEIYRQAACGTDYRQAACGTDYRQAACGTGWKALFCRE